jgi:DNA-binding CsgD family transcriptional regulator
MRAPADVSGESETEREWALLDRLVGRLYDCALDPAGWDGLLADVTRLISPPGWDVAMLMWEGFSPPAARFIGAAGVSPVVQEIYTQSYSARNPWTQKLNAVPLGAVVDTDEIMTRAEFTASALYRDFLKAFGMEVAVAVTFDRSRTDDTGLVMLGPPDRDLARLKRGLRVLAPHFQRALRISDALGEARLRAAAAEGVLDRAPVAIATLTADLTVMGANAKALALADGGPIVISGGRLAFKETPAREALARLAASPESGSVAFQVRAADGRELSVLGARLNAMSVETLLGARHGACVVLAIGVGATQPLIDSDRLSAWFGLSPAEAMLVAALAAGEDLTDYAAQRNVTAGAIRFHLKNIYRKTGVATRAQLVARVRDLPTA